MGTGKSIARAILGALGGGAEYYGDINKQRMLSSDDLYNALAKLQMGEGLRRTAPDYELGLESSRLEIADAKQRLADAARERSIRDRTQADIIRRMKEAQDAVGQKDRILNIAKEDFERMYPGQTFMPESTPTAVATEGLSEFERGSRNITDAIPYSPTWIGGRVSDFVRDRLARGGIGTPRTEQGAIAGPDLPISYDHLITQATPEQTKLASLFNQYSPEDADLAAIEYQRQQEAMRSLEQIQQEAFAKKVGEGLGKQATVGDWEAYLNYRRSIPPKVLAELDEDEVQEMFVQARRTNPSAPLTWTGTTQAGTELSVPIDAED